MKYLLILISAVCFAAESPIEAQPTAVTSLGVVIPLKTSLIRDFIADHNLVTLPLTSGVSNGVEVGRHYIINDNATIGGIVGLNMFVGSSGGQANQIYQSQMFLVGRLFFGDSWRSGLYAELGAGLELSAASFPNVPSLYQANIGSRVGIGYNYKFTGNVTIGAALLTSPSLSLSNITDGTRVAISMLW